MKTSFRNILPGDYQNFRKLHSTELFYKCPYCKDSTKKIISKENGEILARSCDDESCMNHAKEEASKLLASQG